MKHFIYFFSLALFVILTSCSNNDEPGYSVFMQPSSIASTDVNGGSQTFEYDEYGRIIFWTQTPNSQNGFAYSAKFDYPDKNTIKVIFEEYVMNGSKRCFRETIKLANNRASSAEGTFISEVNGNTDMRKTYRLVFEYDNSNHLAIVRHSEVVGIDSDIRDDAWDKAWSWENYLIWEDGNLKEFQDYQGHSSLYRTTKYDYSIYAVEYPIIIPFVVNNAHHTPLFMQGVFGLNSTNCVKTVTILDKDGNMNLLRQYTCEFEDARIIEYTETNSYNTAFSNSISYTVNWAER